MSLVCPRFQHPRILKAAEDKRFPIKRDEPAGYPTAAIQYSLHQLGIPLPKSMAGGKPDGKFKGETHQGVIAFQHAYEIKPEDGKAGPHVLTVLDAEISRLPDFGGPVPYTGGPAAGAAPDPYGHLPAALRTTLRRSYDENTADRYNLANAMGWPPAAKTPKDITFKEVLDSLNSQGLLAVMQAVHSRCLATSGLWDQIHAIRNAWTYSAGGGVSQGMLCTCKDPNAMLAIVSTSPNFCEDIFPMNADHQRDSKGRLCLSRTFREIVAGGEGLHVCIVTPAYRGLDAWGGEHSIHIDKNQIRCKKYHAIPGVTLQAPNGSCLYLDIVEHAKDAIPYFLKKFGIDVKIGQIIGGLSSMAQSAGGIHAVNASKVADLFSQTFPLMPKPVAEQAAAWLIGTMKQLAAKLGK